MFRIMPIEGENCNRNMDLILLGLNQRYLTASAATFGAIARNEQMPKGVKESARRAHELSGGQKQRVCIGHALTLRPKLCSLRARPPVCRAFFWGGNLQQSCKYLHTMNIPMLQPASGNLGSRNKQRARTRP